MPHKIDLTQLAASLQQGDTTKVAALTAAALEAGLEPKEILDTGLIAGMAVVGNLFKTHEIFLPDVLMAAKAMQAGMDLIKPLLEDEGAGNIGRIVIGTVQGDQHDMGKNLVGIMLKGAGLDVIDLGRDVSPEKFVEAAAESQAGFIGMSALLTTTMPVMKKVVNLARERGLHPDTKIIIGGAPLSAEYAEEIGADAYCFDGLNAVDCVKSFIKAS